MGFYYKINQNLNDKNIEISHMFITSLDNKWKYLHISLLDQHNQYTEYEVEIRHKYLTPFVGARIRSLFSIYKITKQTEIIFDNSINKQHPLYLYMMFIRQHLEFNLRTTSLEQILRRIVQYHHSLKKNNSVNNITFNSLNKIWNKIIETKKCPWITQEYDYYIQNMPLKIMKIKKIIRLGMYYSLIKEAYMKINRKYLQNQTLI